MWWKRPACNNCHHCHHCHQCYHCYHCYHCCQCCQWVSESVTRSPMELFWTAKKYKGGTPGKEWKLQQRRKGESMRQLHARLPNNRAKESRQKTPICTKKSNTTHKRGDGGSGHYNAEVRRTLRRTAHVMLQKFPKQTKTKGKQMLLIFDQISYCAWPVVTPTSLNQDWLLGSSWQPDYWLIRGSKVTSGIDKSFPWGPVLQLTYDKGSPS